MTFRRPLLPILSLVTLALAPGLRLTAADPTPAPPQKPGYSVVLDLKVNEQGAPEEARVFKSDDGSAEHILEQIALEQAHRMKFDPQVKDGQPVKFTVRRPFMFPIEGDEGPDANLAPKPSLRGRAQMQPVYPAELAAKGEVGSAILEVIVGADGSVRDVTVLRATLREFGESAATAVKQWQFSPAVRNGAPVSSRWRLAIVFQTDVREPSWEWRIAPRPALGSYTVLHRTQPLPPAAETPAVPPPATPPAK
jgi:TonB family protein